ncbi:hypothetical protein BraRD5C2_37990 [Bradyrhizobium sp. RD5-C2]|nr:hypothetical protein BraRD5C2_37990 [Bradyrhizobium sp. RD5-C2]
MCNPHSITTNQAAILNLFKVVNRYVGRRARPGARARRYFLITLLPSFVMPVTSAAFVPVQDGSIEKINRPMIDEARRHRQNIGPACSMRRPKLARVPRERDVCANETGRKDLFA